MIKIELTEEQKELLEPFFQSVRDANFIGSSAAIGAQIWPDGMVVKLFLAEKVRALSVALGGDCDRCHSSAEGRIDTHKTEVMR
jgi:hypothetical protein